ncbi:MAG: ATP-binding protein [Bacteroidota bacterium]
MALVENWNTTLESLVKGAMYALQCDAAVVIPYNEERAEFEFPVFDGVLYRDKVFFKVEEGRVSAYDRILEYEHDMHIAHDVVNDELLTGEFVKREGIKSAIGIRLEASERGKRRMVGVMFFNYRKEKREIDEQEQEDIRLFASLAANTIRSAQVYRKLDTIRKTARTFAYKNLGIKKDLAGTLNSIASGIKDTLQCDLVVLHEYALEEKQFKTPFYYAGNEHPIPPKKRSSGKHNAESAILHYVLTQADMLTTNGGANINFLKGSFPEREDIKSTAALALGVGEERVGVLFVSYRQDHRFTETEQEDIKLFADQAAIAIRNAQLYQGKQMETQKYEMLLHNSPGGVLAVNRQGKVIFSNEKLQRMLGYTKAELIGKHVDELYGGGKRQSRQFFRNLVVKGRLDQEDASAITRDGHRIPTLLTAALLDMPNDPEEVFGIGIVEDQRVVGIGGRTGKVLELTRQMAQYERMHEVVNLILLAGIEIFNASDIGCLLIKEEGKFVVAEESNCGHVFRDQKSFRLDHSVVTRKAVDGKPHVVSDFPPEDDSFIPFSEASKSGVLIPFMGEKECLGVLYLEKDVPRFFNEEDDMLRVFAAQGALALMRAQLISKQKSWESTKDELFDMSKSVVAGQIASTFLHEVKNSLNIIVVNARQLKRKIEREAGIKKKDEYLMLIQAIHDGVKSSAKLAKESQRFKGQLVANKSHVYLNEVLDHTIRLVEPALERKRLKYEVRLDPKLSRPVKGAGYSIFVDNSLIELVLINLLMNAIDASSERSKITITSIRNKEYVQFEVIDSGHGIDLNNMKNIFRPFFTMKKQTGVGLGLYICKLIVEDQHQGTIEVKSVPGRTSFSVRLPVSS